MPRQKFNILQNVGGSPDFSNPAAVVKEETSAMVSSMMQRLDSPKADSPLDCYKIIPRNKVRDNKKNDYPIVEIESLKESILQFGLIQDISVIYIVEEDMYVIEAGHRRRTAIDQLIYEFAGYDGENAERYALYQKNVAKYERGYVCKVSGTVLEDEVYDSEDEADLASLSENAIDSEIRLIITNKEVRSEDAAVKMRNIQRLSRLYERKNLTLPKDQRINVNEQIGKDMNLKSRQVAYYKSMGSLIPELKEELYKNHITLKEGSGIAKLGEEEQREILDLVKEKASKSELNATIAALKKKIKNLEPADHTSSTDRLLKADMKIKSSMEQAVAAVNVLLKNIETYRRLKATETEITRLSISSEEDIQKSKRILVELLS